MDKKPPPSEATARVGLEKLNEELKKPSWLSLDLEMVPTASIFGFWPVCKICKY